MSADVSCQKIDKSAGKNICCATGECKIPRAVLCQNTTGDGSAGASSAEIQRAVQYRGAILNNPNRHAGVDNTEGGCGLPRICRSRYYVDPPLLGKRHDYGSACTRCAHCGR